MLNKIIVITIMLILLIGCKTTDAIVKKENIQPIVKKAMYFVITTKNENKDFVADYLNKFIWDQIYSDLSEKSEYSAKQDGVDDFLEIGTLTMDVLLKVFRFGLDVNIISSNIEYDELSNLFVGKASFYIKQDSFDNAFNQIYSLLNEEEKKGLFYLKKALDKFYKEIKN